jgi:hypothetical protein
LRKPSSASVRFLAHWIICISQGSTWMPAILFPMAGQKSFPCDLVWFVGIGQQAGIEHDAADGLPVDVVAKFAKFAVDMLSGVVLEEYDRLAGDMEGGLAVGAAA